MSRIGQYLSHLKAYDGKIISIHEHSMNQTIHCYFRCYEKQVTMAKERYSISQLSKGVEGPDFL